MALNPCTRSAHVSRRQLSANHGGLLGQVDAFYLSCISLATVGYGDINPGNNPSSQLFTSVWLLMGTVVIAKAIGGALTYVLDTSRRDIMMNSVNVQALDAKKLLLMDEDGDGVITRIEFLTRMLVKMNKVTTNDIKYELPQNMYRDDMFNVLCFDLFYVLEQRTIRKGFVHDNASARIFRPNAMV